MRLFISCLLKLKLLRIILQIIIKQSDFPSFKKMIEKNYRKKKLMKLIKKINKCKEN